MSLAPSFRGPLGLCALALLLAAAMPGRTAADQPSMPDDAKIVFLHHSTGGVIWGGGVPEWFTAYNTAHGTSYDITEQAFPAAPYPWDNYPYDYWNIWVNHAGGTPYQGNPTLELLTPEYDVIVFKHCFPVSSIGPDTGDPDVSSAEKTSENYQAQYAALKTALRAFPANRFVVWTGAALLPENTTYEEATRAKQFFDWVRTTWNEPNDNIYVWDFFDLETDGGIYLTAEHGSGGDPHPNGTFAAEVAPLFAQHVVEVIRGRGDSADFAQVPLPGTGSTFALSGANPARGTMRLRLDLAAPTRARVTLHDLAGRRMALLADGESPAGTRYLTWNPHGAGAPSGVYFVRVETPAGAISRRFVVLD